MQMGTFLALLLTSQLNASNVQWPALGHICTAFGECIKRDPFCQSCRCCTAVTQSAHNETPREASAFLVIMLLITA